MASGGGQSGLMPTKRVSVLSAAVGFLLQEHLCEQTRLVCHVSPTEPWTLSISYESPAELESGIACLQRLAHDAGGAGAVPMQRHGVDLTGHVDQAVDEEEEGDD